MKRVALITGGSRGIGYGIAIELAKNNFDLAINGKRPQSEVQECIDTLKELGSDVIYCQGNVAISNDRKQMLDAVIGHYQQLNLLVNNAGIAPKLREDILDSTEDSFDEVMNTNLKGPYFLTQLAANLMIAQQKNKNSQGCIINISSVSSTMASVNRGEYCLSKAAVSMATKLFATRLGEFNIPVFEVRPGVIATDMTASVKAKYDQLITEGLFLQHRWGTPEDVGKAVAALARGDFNYSTGQVIMVDGGLTLPRL